MRSKKRGSGPNRSTQRRKILAASAPGFLACGLWLAACGALQQLLDVPALRSDNEESSPGRWPRAFRRSARGVHDGATNARRGPLAPSRAATMVTLTNAGGAHSSAADHQRRRGTLFHCRCAGGERRGVQEFPSGDLHHRRRHQAARRSGDIQPRFRAGLLAAQVRQGLYRGVPQSPVRDRRRARRR